VTHFDESLERALQLDLRLRTVAANQASRFKRNEWPTLLAELLEQSVAPHEAPFLIVEAGATARFNEAHLFARKHQGDVGLGPIDEYAAIGGNRVDLRLAPCRQAEGGTFGGCDQEASLERRPFVRGGRYHTSKADRGGLAIRTAGITAEGHRAAHRHQQ